MEVDSAIANAAARAHEARRRAAVAVARADATDDVLVGMLHSRMAAAFEHSAVLQERTVTHLLKCRAALGRHGR